MLNELQIKIENYLVILGGYPSLQATAIVFAFGLLAWLVSSFASTILRRFINLRDSTIQRKLVRGLRRVLFVSVFFVGAASATSILKLPENVQIVVITLLKMFALIVWTGFVLTLSKSLLRAMAARPDRHTWLSSQSLPLFENMSNILIIVLAVYYLFSLWNVDMTAWLASAGIVGIAVGFAAKDTLANLFSGVFILADAPYKIGDYVVLDSGERGEITHIGIRSTRLLTRDDIEVTIPNSIMGNSKIINESGGPYEKSRLRVRVGVAYGSDIDIVRDILVAVAESSEAVCADPEPRVRMRQFGTSSLDFELCCWIDQPALRGGILDQLLCSIYKRFIEQGVEIPYTKQDLYIKEIPEIISHG